MRKIPVATILVLALATTVGLSAQTPPFTRTIIVNKVGSNAANGAELLSALSNLNPAPSSRDRWVIKIEGGVYHVGTTPIEVPPYVDLEGSGVDTTFVQGSVEPVFPLLLGGLVQPSSNVEIRELTIRCVSTPVVPGCQAMSLVEADTRLTDIRIQALGTGTENHWGVRTFDSDPVLDRVEILATGTGTHNYGIVYGGNSTLNITRSSIRATNAAEDNWAIVLREDTQHSVLRDSIVTAAGGDESAGIRYISSNTDNDLLIDNTEITSLAATKSVGIGDNNDTVSSPRIIFRHGRLYGDTHGFEHDAASVDFVNSEVHGTTVRVIGNQVRIGGTWLRGNGSLFGVSSIVCAGTFDDAYTFFANACPP